MWYCIVFIHFYSAYHSMSFSEELPTTAIDTASEFTHGSEVVVFQLVLHGFRFTDLEHVI